MVLQQRSWSHFSRNVLTQAKKGMVSDDGRANQHDLDRPHESALAPCTIHGPRSMPCLAQAMSSRLGIGRGNAMPHRDLDVPAPLPRTGMDVLL